MSKVSRKTVDTGTSLVAAGMSARRCSSDRRRQTIPGPWRSHWERTVAERRPVRQRDNQCVCDRRTKTTTTISISASTQTVGEVWWSCSVKTAMWQRTQPKLDPLRDSKTMEFTDQWSCGLTSLPRKSVAPRRSGRTVSAELGTACDKILHCESKNCATFIFTVTLANVGRFLKFFQCRNQKEMAHNKNEKFPTVA